MEILLHLKEIFNLESIDSFNIEKKDNEKITITFEKSLASIMIRLYKDRKKVEIMSTVDNQYPNFEYGIEQIGSEILVIKPKTSEESLIDIADNAKRQIEQLMYEFVYVLAVTIDSERGKEFSYYGEILSKDNKSMSIIENIYQDRHKRFECGYKMLKSYSNKQ